jgi:alpha-1,2-mannosyltransferase
MIDTAISTPFMNHLKRYGVWYAFAILMQAVLLVYYWFQWANLTRFALAIDHNPEFMQDFLLYYYPMGRHILQSPIPVSGYLYTSFFGILLVPLGLLPQSSAMLLWFAIEIIFLIVIALSARGLLNLSPAGALFLLGLLSSAYPTLHNIKWGQVSILLTGCIVAAFYFYKAGKPILAGTLLAFASAIKYYPALFLVYFLIKRDARASLSFAAGFIFFYAVFPASLLGFHDWLAFERAALSNIHIEDGATYSLNSQYIADVGFRAYLVAFKQMPESDIPLQILTVIGFAVALFCFALAWKTQRMVGATNKHTLAMTALFLSIPFVVRTSWPHYLVYLPVCQVILFSHFSANLRASSRKERWLIILPVASIMLTSIFFFNHFRSWIAYNGYSMLFFANLFLLIALHAAIAIKPKSDEPPPSV